jgi:hypothetical protein
MVSKVSKLTIVVWAKAGKAMATALGTAHISKEQESNK